MTDEMYQAYNGALPSELRHEIFHGGRQAYHEAVIRTVEESLQRRLDEIRQSLCVWRLAAHYPPALLDRMLALLSKALSEARQQGIMAYSYRRAARRSQ